MAVLMREAIGDGLRRARTARRRTLRDVAGKAKVSLGYLSEVERGRKEPSSELLAAICEALDLALHELLSEAAASMAASLMTTGKVRQPIGLRHMQLHLAGSDGATSPAVLPLGPAQPSAPRAMARAAA